MVLSETRTVHARKTMLWQFWGMTRESPPPEGTPAFAVDIRPMFREKDHDAMRRAFDLWDYADVVRHAAAIGSKLHDGSMPCDGPWSAEQLAVFDRWVEQGTPP
jgi:hypothetical protein